MTAVFQSCLPRSYSGTNQSISTGSNSHRSQSNMSVDEDVSSTRRSLRRRGPRFTRIGPKPISLLKRLVDTIFGHHLEETTVTKNVKRPSKRVAAGINAQPTPSTLRKQFEDNEKTLRSLVSLLTHLQSNATTTQASAMSPPSTSQECEHARNNNRLDDT